MMSRKNLHLFKERITLSNYTSMIKELSDAVDGGASDLAKLLFSAEAPEQYSDHGSYRSGQHNYCEALDSGRFTERRLCKCMYYRSSIYTRRCDKCAFQNRFGIVGDYKIVDYEVPAFYYGEGIGKIDLIISGGDADYATEVKPYKGNNETLLRMIAEIMTYTEGYPKGIYKKAIAFFEKNRDDGKKTAQQEEYENAGFALTALLKKADITVFRFEEAGRKEYRICKL